MNYLAFLDTKVNEGKFQQELVDAIVAASNYWSIAKTFYKIAVNFSWGTNESNKPNSDIYVARHVILKNSSISNSYLGIAIVGRAQKVKWSDVPTDSRPVTGADLSNNVAFVDWVRTYVENLEPVDENDPKYTKFFDSTTIYFYMIERLPDVADNSWNVVFLNNLEQACLDIEVWSIGVTTTMTDDGPSYSAHILEPQLGVMQSPISKVLLRSNKLEDFYNETYQVPQNQTNWWYDSKIAVRGCVNDKSIFIIMQADTVPAWEDNIVPSIPLYYGLIEPFEGAGDFNSVAFFAGTTPDLPLNSIPAYDFNDYSRNKFQTAISPILKSYPRHPSNGINTVMVQRARLGARYQEYFLSWNTAPNAIPPDRKERHETDFTEDNFDRYYPRAWNHPESDEYKYWFNPSRYSGKIHTSKIYIMHPEEGLVGALYNSIGLSSVGILGGKIKVLVNPCGEPKYEYYRYFVVDGISPLTTRPGTVFRPVGLGIYDESPIV